MFNEEHLFTLKSNDSLLSVDEVIAEFGLVEYRDYIARCTAAQQEHQPAVAQREPDD